LHLDILHKMVTIVQYILTAILIFVVLQILVISRYSTFMLSASTAVSYIVAISMLVLLAIRFFSWFKSNRNSVVLLYGLSSATLAINAIFTLTFVQILSFSWPKEVYPVFREEVFLASGSLIYSLNQVHFISSIVAFTITWLATVLLLRHYTQRVGRLRFWSILSIPLAFFLSQFVTSSLNLFAPLLKSDPVFFGILLTLIFTLSKPVGGILIGIAFWTLAKNIGHGSVVIGEDMKLRQSIRKYALTESKLLDSIGTAQLEQEIQRRVITMTREHQHIIEEEIGIQSSLNEDDIKQYVVEVLKTIKRNK
jgi:hypothetical protein